MILFLRQTDGLGNQLFQYAAGCYFAHLHDADLKIIPDPIVVSPSGNRPRPFGLLHFCITAPICQRRFWDRLLCTTNGYRRPIGALARLFSGTQVYQQRLEDAWHFEARLNFSNFSSVYYLKGYLQAYQYALAVEPQLREELRFREEPTGKNSEVLDAIRACGTAVSLHVRRGDYTTLNGGKLALPMSYYDNAIRAVRARLPRCTLFVFSDDISFARTHLKQYESLVFVDHNDEAHGHEDLRLMSACGHHIIANSSLSWWGAWLNPDPDKLVFTPDRWLDPERPATDLIPPAWIRIATNRVAE